MFKKLASLLFEEEEEILEEEPAPVKPEPKPKPLKPEPKPKPVLSPEPVKKGQDEPVVPLSEEKIRNNFGIEADDPDEGDTAPLAIKAEPFKPAKPVKAASPEPKPVLYEFHPVLSPMFGVSETSKKDSTRKAIPEATPILPKSRINTVISPIYGDMEATAEVKHINLPETQKPAQTQVEPEPLAKPAPGVKVAFDNFDLDALLNTLNDETDEPLPSAETLPDIQPDDSEAHQFSLFDDLK